MANETKIQWCDSTVNPIMGCSGCELFPPRLNVLREINAVLVKAGVPRDEARSEPLFKRLVAEAYGKIKVPTPHHKKTATTTNIWHLRDDFKNVIEDLHGKDAAKAVERAIGRSITCYAAKLHLNKGYGLKPTPKGAPRQPKEGYAPTFEEITTFDGRVWESAKLPDLLGKEDPDRPWISELPRLIFVSDMGDALSRKSDSPFLKREVIAPIMSEDGRRHLWLWLTKQPQRMAEFADSVDGLPDNVCAMTTVTGPDTLHRLKDLRRVKAKVRGLSLEPLWERLPPSKLNLKGIDWVILGGESGKRDTVRPFPLEWAEEMRDLCARKGVAFFLKQLGRNPTRGGKLLSFANTHGGDWDQWKDESLKVRQFPDYFHQYRSGEGSPGLRRAGKGGLTVGEKEDFKRLNKVVDKAAKSFVKASAALYEIRERRLCRARHKTFQAYCESVHQISRNYANRLIMAGKVRAEMVPIVTKLGLPIPDNEAQLRELARVHGPGEREAVLEATVEIIESEEDGQLTARVIRQVVDARLNKNGTKPATRKMTPSMRLEKAREKLDELEEVFARGEDPKKMLAALRRVLKG